jgi:hypothetical protein
MTTGSISKKTEVSGSSPLAPSYSTLSAHKEHYLVTLKRQNKVLRNKSIKWDDIFARTINRIRKESAR